MGGSVAVAALGSALAFIIHQLRAVSLLEFILAVLALCVAAMVPALLLAFIRIYNRDLAVVLEAAARNFRQKQMGYNAAIELAMRSQEFARREAEDEEEDETFN